MLHFMSTTSGSLRVWQCWVLKMAGNWWSEMNLSELMLCLWACPQWSSNSCNVGCIVTWWDMYNVWHLAHPHMVCTVVMNPGYDFIHTPMAHTVQWSSMVTTTAINVSMKREFSITHSFHALMHLQIDNTQFPQVTWVIWMIPNDMHNTITESEPNWGTCHCKPISGQQTSCTWTQDIQTFSSINKHDDGNHVPHDTHISQVHIQSLKTRYLLCVFLLSYPLFVAWHIGFIVSNKFTSNVPLLILFWVFMAGRANLPEPHYITDTGWLFSTAMTLHKYLRNIT